MELNHVTSISIEKWIHERKRADEVDQSVDLSLSQRKRADEVD